LRGIRHHCAHDLDAPKKNLPANCREKRPKDTMPSDIRKLDKKALQTIEIIAFFRYI